MEGIIFLAFMIFAGLFSIFCAVKNYDWFIENRKAWIFLKLFGRTGTRIFYVILGVVVIIFASLAYINGQL